MLISTYKTEGKLPNGDEYPTHFTFALLDRHHGEYSLNIRGGLQRWHGQEQYERAIIAHVDYTDYFNLTWAWDPTDLMMLFPGSDGPYNEQHEQDVAARVTAAFHALFHDSPIMNWDKLDEAITNGYILAIDGTEHGLIRCCRAYIEALDTEISGDDDVYDYWPNTIDMIAEFANDLDKELDLPARYAISMVAELQTAYKNTRDRYIKREREFISQHQLNDEEPTDEWFADEICPMPNQS